MKAKWIFKIAIGAIVFSTLAGWLVMSLWNWLVPVLFSGPVIDFWQALGMLLLSRILLGGSGAWKRSTHRGMQRWRSHFEEMSPEERERVRDLWKQRCRKHGSAPAPSNTGETES